MVNRESAIGVFDSGVGGLTVLKELRRILPHEDIIYVGDTKRVPYGSRDKTEIVEFMQQILRFLATKDVKMAVFACNTINACGYDEAVGKYPFLLTPMNYGVSAAVTATKSKRVGVIATERTISSAVHQREAALLDSDVTVYGVGCPRFVPLIERGVTTGEQVAAAVRDHLAGFDGTGIDALILGCTHFPIIETMVGRIAGSAVTLINPARLTADDAKRRLIERGMLNQQGAGGSLNMYFSGDLTQGRKMAELVLAGAAADYHAVDLAVY